MADEADSTDRPAGPERPDPTDKPDLNAGYGALNLSQRRRERSSGSGLIPTIIESILRGLGG